ncbi:MAG: E2 ligase fold family C protein [Armatimonas sp.]
MALADFLDKAALAASHVLSGFDPAVFTAILDEQVVGVFFDEAGIASTEGAVTLELAVNLLARLYPSLALIPLGKNDAGESYLGDHLDALASIARAINPKIQVVTDPSHVTVGIAVGSTAPPTSTSPVLFVGSHGWVTMVSPEHPVGSGISGNPFGAAAAACFAAANVFRIVFTGQLQRGELDQAWHLSLLDLLPTFTADAAFHAKTNPTAELLNPEWETVDIGEVHLAGVGAVGSSAVWTLSRAATAGGLSGTLHLIDPETYDVTNLQRYVLPTRADVETSKALRAAAAFPVGGNFNAIAHVQRWDEYLAERNTVGWDWKLDHVAVALDSGDDRCSLQAALPRRIVNAWTQTGDLGISRHDFLGNQACLMCMYFPNGPRKGRHELIAEAVGLPELASEMAQLLYSGAPLGAEWISRLAQATGVSVESLQPFQNEPLEGFYSKAVCGGMILAAGGGARPVGRAEVPLAFQSALAGVLLAAEVVAYVGGLRPEPMATTTKIDMLRPLGRHLSLPEPKHPSGLCICQDPGYISAYQQKYQSIQI